MKNRLLVFLQVLVHTLTGMINRCPFPNWDDMWLKNQKSKNVNPGKSLILSVTTRVRAGLTMGSAGHSGHCVSVTMRAATSEAGTKRGRKCRRTIRSVWVINQLSVPSVNPETGKRIGNSRFIFLMKMTNRMEHLFQQLLLQSFDQLINIQDLLKMFISKIRNWKNIRYLVYIKFINT